MIMANCGKVSHLLLAQIEPYFSTLLSRVDSIESANRIVHRGYKVEGTKYVWKHMLGNCQLASKYSGKSVD